MSIDDQIKDKKTCADRIHEALRDREEYINELIDACDNDESFDGYDEAYEALDNYFLGMSEYKLIKLEISWGGPSDYLEVKLHYDDDDINEIISIHYHFADWFDHAVVEVQRSSPIWDLVTRTLSR